MIFMGPKIGSSWKYTLPIVILILISARGVETGSDDQKEQETPTATVTVAMSQMNYEFYISRISNPTPGIDVTYQLLDENRIPIQTGNLQDIYNVLLRDPNDGSIMNNASWEDTNQLIASNGSRVDPNGNDLLSSGDTIRLLGEGNDRWNNTPVEPGVANSGMIFELIYIPTGKAIVEVELA